MQQRSPIGRRFRAGQLRDRNAPETSSTASKARGSEAQPGGMTRFYTYVAQE
ncbi:hypothetical protein AAFN86_08630 [Roseomonas sp. CAU 1739]